MNKRALGRFAAIAATVMLAAFSVASAGPGGGGGGGGAAAAVMAVAVAVAAMPPSAATGGLTAAATGGLPAAATGGLTAAATGGLTAAAAGVMAGEEVTAGEEATAGVAGAAVTGAAAGDGGSGSMCLFLPLVLTDTYWWGDVPYYYADSNYYLWDNDAGAYETVEPPGTLTHVPPYGSSMVQGAPLVSPELFAYPKAGQSEAQQKQDKDECSRWAAGQTGSNPTPAQAPTPAPATPAQAPTPAPAGNPAGSDRQAYLRAEAACLEGRNYSVR